MSAKPVSTETKRHFHTDQQTTEKVTVVAATAAAAVQPMDETKWSDRRSC